MLVPNRHGSSTAYRYGFQGQEKDDELKGEGNSLNYTFRMHDPRVGRFFATDPMFREYPFYSPYQFSGNRVIDMVELEGLEPAKSGSYNGQGAIAPKLDEKCNEVKGTENQRWTWNNQWSETKAGVTNSELTGLFRAGNKNILKALETTLNLEGTIYGIDSQKELNGFIAQTGFETEGFTKLSEDVHRYTFKNLRGFKRLDDYSDNYLKSIVGDGLKVSQALYKGSGDLDYRGRGLIHTTWKENYKMASANYNKLYSSKYDFTKTPGLLSTDNQIAVRCALIFFQKNGLFDMKNYNINKVSETVNKYDA
jgi:RHS repeat-associated protein